MSEEISISQKAAIGSSTTQIANQTNYYGITPEQASEIAIKLFIENFPKLEVQAMQTVQQRVDELTDTIVKGIIEKAAGDFSAFADPDMQYILTEAEKGYARRGTTELCAILSSLIVDRSVFENDRYLITVLDKAIQIVPSLQPEHLDYISIIFLYKHQRFGDIITLDNLKARFSEIHKCLQLKGGAIEMIPFLDMEGILTIKLGKAIDTISKSYNFPIKDVINALPPEQRLIPGDYGLTPVGIVLAIFNLRYKTKFQFRLETWIKGI